MERERLERLQRRCLLNSHLVPVWRVLCIKSRVAYESHMTRGAALEQGKKLSLAEYKLHESAIRNYLSARGALERLTGENLAGISAIDIYNVCRGCQQ